MTKGQKSEKVIFFFNHFTRVFEMFSRDACVVVELTINTGVQSLGAWWDAAGSGQRRGIGESLLEDVRRS